ncbi:hypothetical protein [Anaerotignum sp.]
MQRFNGFIKIHRKLVSWGWYQDHVVKDLFLHLILTANFREQEWMGRTIMPGQVVTSYAHLARDLGFSVKQIRTALDKLKRTGEVASEATNRYTIVTIVNWEKYQLTEEEEASERASKEANKGQAEGKQEANKGQQLKNDKNAKKEKNNKKDIVRHQYGEYKNVLLTDEEMDKLKAEFPNDWKERIERLSFYMASTGKSYKSHLATIRNWARKDAEKGGGYGKGNHSGGQAGNAAEKGRAEYKGVQLNDIQL